MSYTLYKPLVYISPDVERMLAVPPAALFSGITTDTPRNRRLSAHRNDISYVPEQVGTTTQDMLTYTLAKHLLHKPAHILVFKNTPRIEALCSAHGLVLLNPSGTLAATIEEKLSQISWLQEDAELLPESSIMLLADITPTHLPCVIQFNHGHTGTGTQKIDQMGDIQDIVKRFPRRSVRVSRYIAGTMYTGNIVVSRDAMLTENISCQITGIAPYATSPFQTIGNDWGYAHRTLTPEARTAYTAIARRIGARMQASGWRGLFGIDVIQETATGALFLIEINARQPASSTYESQMQHALREQKKYTGYTTIEAHIAALFGTLPKQAMLIPLTDGAQLFDRRTKDPVAKHFPTSILQNAETLTL
jgi:hypothetical protein